MNEQEKDKHVGYNKGLVTCLVGVINEKIVVSLYSLHSFQYFDANQMHPGKKRS